ncbi:MAG: hypothetical protein ACEQSR_06190 [Candidatus Methylacidiphilales bacterium]
MNGGGSGNFDTTSLDSTVFYMEAAINYEYANFENQLEDVITKTDVTHFSIPITSNNVLISDVKTVYDDIVDFVKSEYDSITSSSKTLKAVNIEVKGNPSGGTAAFEVDVILGKGTSINFEAGTRAITGDRYWDWSTGFCIGTAGDGFYKEIVRLGNYNMNIAQLRAPFGKRLYLINIYPSPIVGPGNVLNSANPFTSSTRNFASDIWAYQTTLSSPNGPCLVESEANWYLNRIPSIITKYRPSGQTFIDLSQSIARPNPTLPYYHTYRLRYGKIQITLDSSNM